MEKKHWKSVGLAGFSHQGARRFFGAILVYHQLWMENDHEVQLALAEGGPPTTTEKNKTVGGENFDQKKDAMLFFFFEKVRCGREMGKEVVVYTCLFLRNAWFFLFLKGRSREGAFPKLSREDSCFASKILQAFLETQLCPKCITVQ